MASICIRLSLCTVFVCGGFTHGVESVVATSEECAQPVSDDHGSDEVPIGAVEFLQVGHKFHMPMPHASGKKNAKKHAAASPNGLMYVCDTARLITDQLCYFITTDESVAVGPHNVDLGVAADGFRTVVDSTGAPLALTPKPWTNGDHLAASDTELVGDLAAYAKAFELVAPLRDAMMFAPETINEDVDRWNALTRAFVDCHVKEHDEEFEVDGNPMTAYSVAHVYDWVKNPNGQDIHHYVLQFLEEGAIDLVCLMTSLSMDSRCPQIREANGVAGTSTCWESAYAGIADIYSFVAPPAPTPGPTPATPAPSPPAPAKPAKR